MKPKEFISFSDKKPDKHKWIVVTNNINAQNAHGEMSHVWMVNFFTESTTKNNGIVAYNEGDRKIISLTHWKYV